MNPVISSTEKLATMISNKFKTYDFDVVEWLEENPLGQFCVVRQDLDNWLIYFEHRGRYCIGVSKLYTELLQRHQQINKINIVDEFDNTSIKYSAIFVLHLISH